MRDILFGLVILILPGAASGQQLVVQVDGEINFDYNALIISEAGEDYLSSVESSGIVYMSVLSDNQLDKKINPSHRWQVSVQKQDIEWNSNFNLEIRRTGTGNRPGSAGSPQLEDGEIFKRITDTSIFFFKGRGEVEQIPLAFRISGISVTMGARNFESRLIFTVMEE